MFLPSDLYELIHLFTLVSHSVMVLPALLLPLSILLLQ